MRDFNQIIRLLEKYKEEHGDCVVPMLYITEDGIKLGKIVSNIRSGNRRTNAEEKDKLDSLGFAWKVNESHLSFEEVIKLLEEYKKKHGDCVVPTLYITEDGIKLGQIVHSIRTGGRKTSAKEKANLDNLGFSWKVRASTLSFEEVIKLLEEYKKKHGDCIVPTSYTTKDGIRLGQIIVDIRSGTRKTSVEEKARLDSLGFVWKVKDRSPDLEFEEVIKLLEKYKEEHGDCVVPMLYITEDGIKLGKIVSNIRSGNRRTNAEEKAKLDSMGFVWKAKKGRKKS